MRLSGSILVLVLALIAVPVATQDLPRDLPRDLARKELAARKHAARELFRLAKYLRQGKAHALARAEFRRALAIHPGPLGRGPSKRGKRSRNRQYRFG